MQAYAKAMSACVASVHTSAEAGSNLAGCNKAGMTTTAEGNPQSPYTVRNCHTAERLSSPQLLLCRTGAV